jgi:thioredoxin reductase (NADPH)
MSRPVLMTVDDDPGVSRAVARDLRRRYGGDFRVVRAESGADALDALRELTLRGECTAAILADYRMPGMNGVEFLEQAMDIVPRARRALLTAYADTDAAIRAINVVDVDHYLLKPWEPPDEKLYPVVDALIETWRSRRRPVRSRRRRCSATAGRPSRSPLATSWPATPSPIAGTTSRNPTAPACSTPRARRRTTCRCWSPPDGTVLKSPSEAEIAAAVGLTTTPTTDFYDLIVIGGGPAGLGSAVYGASEGLRTVLVERQATGGQAGQSSRIENYLGFPDGVSGAQLTDRARRQAAKFGTEVLTARDVVGLEARGSARVVKFGDGTEIAAHSVVLATGVSYRALAAPGVTDLTGRGVFYGSASTEAPTCRGLDVYIVGGANSAGQAAVFFSRHAKTVTLLVRGPSLEASMSYYLIKQLEEIDNVVVRTRTEVVEAQGTSTSSGSCCAATRTASRRSSTAARCSSSSAPHRARSGSTVSSSATAAASSAPARTS